MLPEKIIPARVGDGRITPGFLGPDDLSWLCTLIEEVDRFRGRPFRELEMRLREPLPCAAPFFKARVAVRLLAGLWQGSVESAIDPQIAREALFTTAAASALEHRDAIAAAAAAKTGITVEALQQSLFADLPGERIVQGPSAVPSPDELVLRSNQLIAKSILSRATAVRVQVEGGVRPVVRQAKLRRLLCTVEEGHPSIVHISGPFALFRRTLLYGRALGDLLSVLPWCGRFELRAECVLRGERGELQLASGAPIFPGNAPKRYDSKLEERFAKELKSLALDWDLIREPEAIPADGTLIFPDFLLCHRFDPTRRFLVEIAGFWTPDYLSRKLARLRAAKIENLILCIDEERQCAEGDLPAGARIVRYRRRIDPRAVLDAISARR